MSLILITFLLLLGGLLLRLILFIGPVGSDDMNYFRFSQKLLNGEPFTELHHHGGRIVFILLEGVPAALLGSVRDGALINVLWFSLRDLLLVLYLGHRVSLVATAAAAGILGFNALSSTYAGLMLPDGLLSMLMVGTALLVFEARDQRGHGRLAMLLVGALCASASYSAKDTGILIVPCAVLWLLYPAAKATSRAKAARAFADAAIFIAGFVAFAGCEMVLYYFLSGDALYRLHAIAGSHNTNGDVSEVTSFINFLRHVYWNFRKAANWEAGSTPVLASMLLAGLLTLLKVPRYAFFALCGGFLSIFLIAGSSSLTRLIPLPVQDRYFEVVVPFLALCIAGWINTLQPGTSQRRAALALPLALALCSIPGVVANAGDMTFSGLARNAAIGVESIQRARPDVPIYVSPSMAKLLQFSLSPERNRSLHTLPAIGPLPDGFYIVNPGLNDNTRHLPRDAEIVALPDYIIVDEDWRVFARYSQRQSRAIAIKIKN